MDRKLNELINELEAAIVKENFIDIAYEIIEEIAEKEDAFESISQILMIMEKNPDADFGKPGPLVHFVEKYYQNGYEEKLIESVKRRPTKHTVWMLNRIINGSKSDSRDYFINILNEISTLTNIDQDVLGLVNHFKNLNE